MPNPVTKRCWKCGDIKPLTAFYKRTGAVDGHRSDCRDCRTSEERHRYQAGREARLDYQRAYYEANAETVRSSQRTYREANRATVFSYYGCACACCGATENLTVDHINGDGAQHRRELYGHPQRGSTRFYIWLIKQGFPSGYQTLCNPCNSSKRNGNCCRLDHAADLERL